MLDIKTLESKIQPTMSTARYHHMLHVAKLAQHLARKHGWDPDLAYRTGFLHDCTKEWSPARMKAYIRKKRIFVPDRKFIERYSPNILHGYVAARWVRENGWLKDRAAIEAISCHTLGRKGMSEVDMIIFIADFASKDRKYKSAPKVRRLADRNLKAAFRMALAKKIKWNLESSKPVVPYTLSVWNWLHS
jgi:predicted HD superfamily hydrolase involved in NAD metabolism